MNRQQERARAIAHQTEAYAVLDVVRASLREAVMRLVEVYAATEKIQTELVEANRQVSGPEFVEARVVA